MKKILLTLLILTLIPACGTLFNGTTQDISFDSNVPGVKVYLDGQEVCTTPCIYPVERASGSVAITARKAGYEDQLDSLKSTFSKISILNLTGVYSWTTDLATGGIWRYNKQGVYLNMEPKKMTQKDKDIFKQESKIRHFVLFSYPQLQEEVMSGKQNGEYLNTLSYLTNKKPNILVDKIKASTNEINCLENIL